MIKNIFSILLLSLNVLANNAAAHEFHQQVSMSSAKPPQFANSKQSIASAGFVQYLGNEALLVVNKQQKLLFDPFFHNDFNSYQLVPDELQQQIFAGTEPFDQIDAIFVSHAHGDHFAVDRVVSYLTKFKQVKLYAAKQAIDDIKVYLAEQRLELVPSRLIAISLGFGDQVWQQQTDGLSIDAIRIPHAGWPQRADVENLVFRVAFNDGSSVMHMGDADPDDEHYHPYRQFLQQHSISLNFPPYWFFFSAEGRDILTELIGAKHNIGIHVPMKVPKQLKDSGYQYYSRPGQRTSF